MKIRKIYLPLLLPEDHYQFHIENKKLIKKHQLDIIGLEKPLLNYEQRIENEATALRSIRENRTGNEIVYASIKCSAVFMGFRKAVKACEIHYNKTVCRAAKIVSSVFEQYSGIYEKSYDDETFAIKELINELVTNYYPELEIMDMKNWVNELYLHNKKLYRWVKRYYAEGVSENVFRIKGIRNETDVSYYWMIKWVKALGIINGDLAYDGFINELNGRIESIPRLHQNATMAFSPAFL